MINTEYSWEHLKGRNHLRDLGVDGTLILKWILKKKYVKCGLDLSDSGEQPIVVSCAY
jgi:hypothetical protein